MSEADFKSTLDPVAIVNNRATAGGPQPAEMKRMIAAAKKDLADQQAWIDAKHEAIDTSLKQLDGDFSKLLEKTGDTGQAKKAS